MVVLILIFLTTQIGTQLTHFLVQKEWLGSVRASTLTTLCFIGISSMMSYSFIPTLQAAFLGSTFIGMSDSKKLSKIKLSMASFVFMLIFHFLIAHFKHFGGALGLSAFISCLLTYYASHYFTLRV